MGISTTIAAIGVAIAGAGVITSTIAASNAADDQKRMEQLRQQQMNLEASRKQREMIRQAQVARATAVNASANQGAAQGSSIQGVEAGISGQGNFNIQGTSQNQQIGNAYYGAAERNTADQTLGSIGQGMSSLGGEMVHNSETIGRVGTYIGNKF